MGLLDGLLGHGTEVDVATLSRRLHGILVKDETPRLAFKIIRDVFVFTERRLILIDVQGVTGSKVAFTSVPYRAIVRFSVETAGTFDLDAEMKIWVSGSPHPIERTLKKGSDVKGIQLALAEGVLR
jgi:hypothetical protein